MSENRHIHLGFLIPNNKKIKIKLPEGIQEQCKQRSIRITEIDINGDFDSQGPFDVLFHKVIDYHKEKDFTYDEAEKLITKTKEFARRNPQMHVIDDFDLAKNLLDRTFQHELLKKCEMKVDDIVVYVPRSLELHIGTSEEDCLKQIEEAEIRFPVLAKPIVSSLEGAHDITIVFNRDNIKDIPIPCVVQEFCNHGGVIYKMFVIGDRVNLCERPSVQDVDCSLSRKSLVFDTRDVCKTGKAFIPELHGTDPNKKEWLSCDENPNLLNRNVVQALQKRLASLTDMKLYGLDILINKEGNYAIIDLNLFPGYSGIKRKHFTDNLVEMVVQLCKQ